MAQLHVTISCCADSHLRMSLLPSPPGWQLSSWLSVVLHPGLIWRNNGEMCYAETEYGDTAELNALLSLMNYGRTLCSLRDTAELFNAGLILVHRLGGKLLFRDQEGQELKLSL